MGLGLPLFFGVQMSACLLAGGEIIAAPPSSCSGYVVMSPAEYTAWIQPQLQTREQNFADGMALGWLVGGVVVVAWAALMVRRALHV